jgi:hypothetical protein
MFQEGGCCYREEVVVVESIVAGIVGHLLSPLLTDRTDPPLLVSPIKRAHLFRGSRGP